MKYPEHWIAESPALEVMERLRDDDATQRERGLPVSERTRNVTAPTGLWLFSLIRSLEPGLIVEIGSSTAYSTIWMALAAREYGGRIVGSEIIPERAAQANANLREADLDDLAVVEAGDGSEIARQYESIDLVFLDAEKDDYPRHFANIIERVRGCYALGRGHTIALRHEYTNTLSNGCDRRGMGLCGPIPDLDDPGGAAAEP